MMQVLFLSNIPTPYQLDFLEELNSQSSIKIFGYFLFSKEHNRDWILKLPDYIIIANFRKKISDYKKIYNFIKNKKIDKIIIGGYTLPTVLFLIALSKALKIDLFFWLERPINKQVGLKNHLKELYLKTILSKAKKILAIGELAVEDYKKYNNNIVNLPYSMNLDNFYKINRNLNEKENIEFLFSGQYIHRKNIINTINAFKKIDNRNIRLNIIGGGELKEEISDLIKNDNRISDLGFVQPQILSAIYRQNDIFIMPSRHDGWALVINEAMASEMPIISTNKVGAVYEYIIHKENGFICDTDVESIKNGINYYLANYELIKQHARKNRAKIRQSLGDVKNSTGFLISALEI